MSEEITSTQAENLTVSFQNKAENVMQAVEVTDSKNGMITHRNLHMLGMMVIFWMFIPILFEDPKNPINWLIMVAVTAIAIFVLRFPESNNKKYANSQEKNAPEISLTVTDQEVSSEDATGKQKFIFAEKMAAYEYKNVIALVSDQNRILTIPKDQLADEEINSLINLLKKKLETRYEKIDDIRSPISKMFKRSK